MKISEPLSKEIKDLFISGCGEEKEVERIRKDPSRIRSLIKIHYNRKGSRHIM